MYSDRQVIFPNPAKKDITINLEAKDVAGTLRILDIRGLERMRKEITTEGLETINVEALAPGLYLLHIESMAGKKSFKFMKN
jgi:hypothetical protein